MQRGVLRSVAMPMGGAVGTVAGAGGFTLLLLMHHMQHNRCNDDQQNETDDNGTDVICKPAQHDNHSLF